MLLLSSCVPQSRLEGRRLSAADFAAAEAHSTANGISGSDSSTTDGMGNGYSQSIREAVDAWWEIAEQRFTTEEVRFCSLFTESATLCSYQIFGQPGCCLHSSLLSSTILVLNCLFVGALCTTVALSALHLLNVPIVTHEYAASHIVNVLAADESK